MACYLLFLSPETARKHIFHDCPSFTLLHSSARLQQEDTIIPVSEGNRSLVLPFIFSVASTNRAAGNITLQYRATLNHVCLLSEVPLPDLNSRTHEYLAITKVRFDEIVAQMGGLRMEEAKLLEAIQQYIKESGYYFDPETVRNYHICLKTRPLVILAGLSGTGKSLLTRLYAAALGHNPHYRRLAVRPNWNDDRYLLGYFNTITNTYMTAPALDFLLRANQEEEDLFFFCLDEMNLAHVEYYFSQFLSAMEEDLGERTIPLLSQSEQAHLSTPEAGSSSLPEEVIRKGHVQIPGNFFVTGTINVDETTRFISDKVMDRANILEFFRVELDKLPSTKGNPKPTLISTSTWQSYRKTTGDTRFRRQLLDISQILNRADLGLGYRVLQEIELYLANSQGLLDYLVAFDLQVKQRILPRIRGSEVIREMLQELHTYLLSQNLRRSVERLEEMQRRLQRDGYTTFWR
jgi:hypothetical protein